MIMTVSSWRNAVLASLLTSEASVAGQQLVLVALSPSPPSSTTDDGSSYEVEPPCRQRRLEPWRQQIREQCFVDAVNRCPVEPRDLRREGHGDTYVPLRSSSSLAITLFGDLFQEAAIKDDVDDDPLDELFNRMMGFSLRAFDQKIIVDEQPASHQEGTEEEEEEDDEIGSDKSFDELESVPLLETPEEEEAEAGEEEYFDDDELWAADEFSEDAEYVASASTPEQAAENALDIMVASFAELTVASSAEVKEVDDAATLEETEEETQSLLPLPPAVDLPRLLAQRGHALLAEGAASAERRRLAEADAAEDPRARVEARLARRLTEYRTDLFFSPADGSVTLYTTHVRAPPSPAVGASPAFLQPPREAPPPALGTGSRHLDACVRSAFQNRDLSGGCHRAVGELLLAVDHGSPASRYHGEFGAATKHDEGENVILAWFSSSSDGEHAEVFFQQAQQKGCPFSGVAMLIGLLCSVFLLQKILDGEEEEDDDNEEELEETEEVVGRFDYATLPNDDTPQVSKGENPSGQPRVFVGVPVQVV